MSKLQMIRWNTQMEAIIQFDAKDTIASEALVRLWPMIWGVRHVTRKMKTIGAVKFIILMAIGIRV